MNRRLVLILALTASVFAGTLSAQTTREKSVLLKGDEAKRLAKQCSRNSPSDFTETWEPLADELIQMERSLSRISSLKAKWGLEGASIENPTKWYLQYAALVWHGKNIIYISAIGDEQPTDIVRDSASGKLKKVPNNSWKEFAIVICDGGNAWGVVYDPKSGKFFDLSVNGIG